MAYEENDGDGDDEDGDTVIVRVLLALADTRSTRTTRTLYFLGFSVELGCVLLCMILCTSTVAPHCRWETAWIS